jgi:hypothetical protein
MSNNFSHQTNKGKTVNVISDYTVVQVLNEPKVLTENIQPDVKRLFDSLKERYQNRYEQKLDGRVEITLKVVKDWNSQQLQTIKEKFNDDANFGEAVEVINDAFEQQGSLLIVGNPGAGKTVLLLKLALNLLEKADIAKGEAFPVIFNLASWSPGYEKFEDWLIAMLNSGDGLSTEFAAILLRQKKIIFLLDGLDELARNEDNETAVRKRADCLNSLNEFLREGRKAVICCRRDEFVQMQEMTKQDAPVSAKVEILDLTEPEILSALEHAQSDNKSHVSAINLLKIVETNKVFLDVLRTPFYFTTALEVFDKHILKENVFPNDKAGIRKYLLDRFIESKLFHTPNPKRFKNEKTRKWLKWLGGNLEIAQLPGFELSYLPPHILRRAWVYKLLYGLSVGLSVWICFKWYYALIFGMADGLQKQNYISTEDIQRLNLANLLSREKWKRALVQGFVTSLFAAFIFSLSGFVIVSLVVGLILGFFIAIDGIVREVSYFVEVDRPYQRLKSGFVKDSVKWAFVCLCANEIFRYLNDKQLVLNIYFIVYLLVGGAIIGFSRTPIFRHFILRLCFYLEGKMPLKYATFLDYASEARILEKDGGQWRFRHQNLQEYFGNLN